MLDAGGLEVATFDASSGVAAAAATGGPALDSGCFNCPVFHTDACETILAG